MMNIVNYSMLFPNTYFHFPFCLYGLSLYYHFQHVPFLRPFLPSSLLASYKTFLSARHYVTLHTVHILKTTIVPFR